MATPAAATPQVARCESGRASGCARRCSAHSGDEHAEGEVRHVGDQRLGGDLPPSAGLGQRVPAQAGGDEDTEQRDLRPQAAPGHAHRVQADEGQHDVEGHLEAERPRHRVEGEDGVRVVVLPEEHEEGQQLVVREPHTLRALRPGEQRKRPDQRDVVGRQDAGRAAQEVGTGGDPVVLSARRPDERAVEEKPREHEEADEAVAELGGGVVPVADRRSRRPVVEPDVEQEDGERGEATEAVEAATAVLCGCLGHGNRRRACARGMGRDGGGARHVGTVSNTAAPNLLQFAWAGRPARTGRSPREHHDIRGTRGRRQGVIAVTQGPTLEVHRGRGGAGPADDPLPLLRRWRHRR